MVPHTGNGHISPHRINPSLTPLSARDVTQSLMSGIKNDKRKAILLARLQIVRIFRSTLEAQFSTIASLNTQKRNKFFVSIRTFYAANVPIDTSLILTSKMGGF